MFWGRSAWKINQAKITAFTVYIYFYFISLFTFALEVIDISNIDYIHIICMLTKHYLQLPRSVWCGGYFADICEETEMSMNKGKQLFPSLHSSLVLERVIELCSEIWILNVQYIEHVMCMYFYKCTCMYSVLFLQRWRNAWPTTNLGLFAFRAK